MIISVWVGDHWDSYPVGNLGGKEAEMGSKAIADKVAGYYWAARRDIWQNGAIVRIQIQRGELRSVSFEVIEFEYQAAPVFVASKAGASKC